MLTFYMGGHRSTGFITLPGYHSLQCDDRSFERWYGPNILYSWSGCRQIRSLTLRINLTSYDSNVSRCQSNHSMKCDSMLYRLVETLLVDDEQDHTSSLCTLFHWLYYKKTPLLECAWCLSPILICSGLVKVTGAISKPMVMGTQGWKIHERLKATQCIPISQALNLRLIAMFCYILMGKQFPVIVSRKFITCGLFSC